MKTFAILGIIAGVLLIGGVFLASANVFGTNEDSTYDQKTTSCSSGSCPYASTGGCSASNNCGLSGCAAATGGSCGCNRG